MKNLFKTALFASVFVIASFGSYKVYSNYTQNNEFAILKANVEALANGESEGPRVKYYTSFTYEYGASVVDYTTCKTKENRTDTWYNLHD